MHYLALFTARAQEQRPPDKDARGQHLGLRSVRRSPLNRAIADSRSGQGNVRRARDLLLSQKAGKCSADEGKRSDHSLKRSDSACRSLAKSGKF